MKFEVRRTSSSDDKPCREARLESCVRVDTRTVSRPEDIPLTKGEDPRWWYRDGRNHRVIKTRKNSKGRIARDFDDQHWVIEINSLEELLAFADKHGELILGMSYIAEGCRRIEIYDDYRE